MSGHRNDSDVAEAIEDFLRRDPWFQFTRRQISIGIGSTPGRVLRILRSDRRFREYPPEKENLPRTYQLWR